MMEVVNKLICIKIIDQESLEHQLLVRSNFDIKNDLKKLKESK